MKIPISEIFDAQRKERKRQNRKEWISVHTFDLVNLFLSLTAIVISVISLILK